MSELDAIIGEARDAPDPTMENIVNAYVGLTLRSIMAREWEDRIPRWDQEHFDRLKDAVRAKATRALAAHDAQPLKLDRTGWEDVIRSIMRREHCERDEAEDMLTLVLGAISDAGRTGRA
jgi:hypothetical protein